MYRWVIYNKLDHATIPLIKSYRMSLISAGSISLDSTFKYKNLVNYDFKSKMPDPVLDPDPVQGK